MNRFHLLLKQLTFSHTVYILLFACVSAGRIAPYVAGAFAPLLLSYVFHCLLFRHSPRLCWSKATGSHAHTHTHVHVIRV